MLLYSLLLKQDSEVKAVCSQSSVDKRHEPARVAIDQTCFFQLLVGSKMGGARGRPRLDGRCEMQAIEITTADERCAALFAAIVLYKMAHDGNTPSFRHLQELCSISSKSVVHYRLCRLEDLGFIRRRNSQIEVVGGEWTLREAR